MLEKEKHGNRKRSGAGANCSDVIASGQNCRAARVAIAAEKICHRDIVNLKQSVTTHAALQEALLGADATTSDRSLPRP
jgi:predicted aspartyl protease